MTKFRFTTLIGAVVGMGGIGLAYLLFRDMGHPIDLSSECLSAALVAFSGAMVLCVSAGFLLLSFTSEKVRENRKGVRVVRAPLAVVLLCFLSAVFAVAVAILSTYLAIFGEPDGAGGFLVLLSLFSVPLAVAVVATMASALVARSWYPSIRFDGNTLVVQTVGTKRSYSYSPAGVSLEASEVAGVFVRGKKPRLIKRGLVPAVAGLFVSGGSGDGRDAAVTTIRIKQRDLDALTAAGAEVVGGALK